MLQIIQMTYKNSKKKKAQASLEYMSIFGIAFVLIALTGGAFFAYTNSEKDNLDQKQINKIGTELLDSIQKIYFFGDTNRRTYKTTFPKGIESLSIHHINRSGYTYYYLNFTIIIDGTYRSLFFQTNEDYISIKCKNCVQVTSINETISTYDPGRLGQGFKNIRIEAINNSVYVDFVD
jgi:membrane-anchored glycerophosphoryl diester phosphodiesterase (GDPDase)